MKTNEQILDDATERIFGNEYDFHRLCKEYRHSGGRLPNYSDLFRVIEIAMQ